MLQPSLTLLLPLFARPPLDGLCLKRLCHALQSGFHGCHFPAASRQQAICSLIDCGTGTFPARHCTIQCAVTCGSLTRARSHRSSLPHVPVRPASRQAQSASAVDNAAGWHKPPLPSRASAAPARRFRQNCPTRVTYSGWETLERRSAASSANGVASFAGVGAVTYSHSPSHVQLLFQRRAERAHGNIDRLVPLQFGLRPPAWRVGSMPNNSRMVSVSTRVGSSLTPCTTTGKPSFCNRIASSGVRFACLRAPL